MRRIGITTFTLVGVVGGALVATGASTAPEDGPRLVAAVAGPAPVAGSEPPPAVVRGCAARIGGGARRGDHDSIVGPLRFDMQPYSPLREWRRLVRRGQWLKSVARVRAGARVTLEVPVEQRPWMRLRYAQRRNGAAAVTLRACRHRRTREAQRRECVWAEGIKGPPASIRRDYTACRSGPTSFSGGFELDFAEAPQQGRCAELIVWIEGEPEPHRVRLIRTEPGECTAPSG